MLFIGRTMNKETQTGQRREREERKKRGNPRSCAYYSRNLTVITESALCKCARLRVPLLPTPPLLFLAPKPSPNRLCARPQSPVLQKEASPVVVMYYWHENPPVFLCSVLRCLSSKAACRIWAIQKLARLAPVVRLAYSLTASPPSFSKMCAPKMCWDLGHYCAFGNANPPFHCAPSFCNLAPI